MNAVLDGILSSNSVTDGERTFPLRHPDFPQLPVHMDAAEGAFLQELIATRRPQVTLEIGCAYGVSTLFICEALAALGHPVRHIVMDPYQQSQWRNIGLRNIEKAGFSPIVDFHEASSEMLLPQLLASDLRIDFALIDGWHTFDQVIVEFYYLNRMLPVGGVLAFDDADRRSVNRVIRHALTYRAYSVFGRQNGDAVRLSVAGRIRRAVSRVPHATDFLRSDFVNRDWDLGIMSSCVALEKIAEDRRSSGWDRSF